MSAQAKRFADPRRWRKEKRTTLDPLDARNFRSPTGAAE
jgi:hypothetical protein